jgi:hypothetical protein
MELEHLIAMVGNLGVAVALAVYFAWWITNHLAQKMDGVVQKLEEMNKAQREFYEKLISILAERFRE